MPEKPRFLLGKGESLTEPVQLYGGGGDKVHPYSFARAKLRLEAPLRETAISVGALPPEACPNDEAVAILTLHPSYIAKSYFPEELLGAVGLRSVGSRAVTIKPEVTNTRQADRALTTVEIFAAGRRSFFKRWASNVSGWSTDDPGAEQLRSLEFVYVETPDSRLRDFEETPDQFLEAILHVNSSRDEYVIDGFDKYVRGLGGKVLIDARIQAGGLCFVAIQIDPDLRAAVAEFSFLRGLRSMPQIRAFDPFRSASASSYTQLPSGSALNPHLRVAIFDGGLPAAPDLSQWVRYLEPDNIGAPLLNGQVHGLAVTSSALFGPITNNKPLPQPLTNIDHYRIADVDDGQSGPHYYKMLSHIVQIIQSEHYDYINISAGPKVSMEDDIIHAWTAKLDELLSHGKTLAFLAVGNTGEDAEPNNRICPPADAVNALGIGSCDGEVEPWGLASYSSVGPGRSPGVMKPDIVVFGGTDAKEFGVLAAGLPLSFQGTTGTSFASPYAMHIALYVAANFGHSLTPLAVKALLVHNARRMAHHNVNHVGWGKVPSDYLDIVTCGEDTVHVAYQGVLGAGKTLRVSIPCPARFGESRVEISATVCFATDVEPQNPVSYTRAGLDIHFRPKSTKRKVAAQRHADTAPFFRSSDYGESEAQMRSDALKWETVISKSKRFAPTSLFEPVFDLHHVPRLNGGPASSPSDVPYGMIVSVRQHGSTTLYDDVLSRYRTKLQPLQAQLAVPIRIYAK